MKMNLRRALAGFTSGAIAVSALVVPSAVAQEATTTDVNLPLACYVQPKGSAAFARTSLDLGNDFALAFKATAPDTVQVGEEFEYVIDPGSVAFPTVMSAQGKTVAVKRLSQANLWIDLPDNVELTSFEFDQNTPRKFSVLEEGGRLRFVGEQQRKDPVEVGPVGFTGKNVGDNPAEWVASNEGRWFYGGAEILKPGDEKLPKVTLKLKATGEPGSTVQPSIRKTDATTLNPDAFVQGLVQGSTKVFFSEKNINALVRCGLSEDYTAPGGKKAAATPFPAVKIVEKEESTEEQSVPVSPTTQESSAPVTSEEEKLTPKTTTSASEEAEPTTPTDASATSETNDEESSTTSTTSEKDDKESSKPAEPTDKQDEKPTTTTTEQAEPTDEQSEKPTTSTSTTSETNDEESSTTSTTSEKQDTGSSKAAEPTEKREDESSKAAEPTDKQDEKPTTTTNSDEPQSPTTTTTEEAPKGPSNPSDGSGKGSTEGSGKGSSEGSAKGFFDGSSGSSELSSSPMGKIVLITLGVLAGLAGLVGIYNCFERNGYIQNCLERIGGIKLPKF